MPGNDKKEPKLLQKFHIRIGRHSFLKKKKNLLLLMCDLGGTRLSEDEELLATGCRCSVRLLGLFRTVGTGE